MRVTIIAFAILFEVFYFGCTCGYKFGKKYFVEGMGFKSAEFISFVISLICLLLFFFNEKIGVWLLWGYYLLLTVYMFMFHWRYTIFGATEKKLKGYNECFSSCIYLVKPSSIKLIPDLYHIIMSVFVLTMSVLLGIFIL